jgi:pantoate kinase
MNSMKAEAFSPSYITGLFVIGDRDAAGAGFAMDRGMKTTVETAKGATKITINSSESAAPVSKVVLRKFSEIAGKIGLLRISHETELPIGYGCGMSAAGALSLSLALNEFLGCGLSREKCVKIAHDADVECGTGLSGVDASAIGGILARRSVKDGVVKLPFEKKEIEIAFYAPIKTSSIIATDEWKAKVNAAGEKSLSLLFKKKNWDGFIAASRMFAGETGLAAWCKEEMEQNPHASMAMLGKTLFSDGPLKLDNFPQKVGRIGMSERERSEFQYNNKAPMRMVKANTCKEGARVL